MMMVMTMGCEGDEAAIPTGGVKPTFTERPVSPYLPLMSFLTPFLFSKTIWQAPSASSFESMPSHLPIICFLSLPAHYITLHHPVYLSPINLIQACFGLIHHC